MDGGFNNKEREYETTYSIVILPDFVELPFPNVELPEKVSISQSLHCYGVEYAQLRIFVNLGSFISKMYEWVRSGLQLTAYWLQLERNARNKLQLGQLKRGQSVHLHMISNNLKMGFKCLLQAGNVPNVIK